jgi:hypothetical protein
MVPKHWCKQYQAEKVEADTTLILIPLRAQCPATLTKPEKGKRPKLVF